MTARPRGRTVGLIGYPLRHSISPAFQQAAFDATGLAVRYELWETPSDEVNRLEERLRRSDTLGANVTIPYKQLVQRFIDRLDPSAAAVGAVNTIVCRDAVLEGYNTDVGGFVEALRQDGETTLTDRRLVVVGAGGAARAGVAAALRERASSVVVCARRIEQAEALVEDFRRSSGDDAGMLTIAQISANGLSPSEIVRAADVVVNATPMGTAHHRDQDKLPVDAQALHVDQIVVDLVYNPPETPLLSAARQRGARTLNGLPMLVYQGAMAFELWTGRDAPIDLMRRVAREALGV